MFVWPSTSALSIFRWELTHWRMPLISFGAQGQVGSDHRHPQRLVPSHSLPSERRTAIFSGKPTTTNKNSLNKALPLRNLKYAVSRWGASFSAEVNAAVFLKKTKNKKTQQPSSQRARKVDSKTKQNNWGMFRVGLIDSLKHQAGESKPEPIHKKLVASWKVCTPHYGT